MIAQKSHFGTYTGLFKPTNPKKYLGDAKNIVYRSSWEAKLFRYLDTHPDVINWASEEIIIPYLSPKDGKAHRYYPDVYVKMKNSKGIVETLLIEVKPKAQTMPPKPPKKKSQKFITESITYAVNQAKWKAAKSFCDKNGWRFVIMTEEHLKV